MFWVLRAFNALFKGIFQRIPICYSDACVFLAEVLVWPDRDIFIVCRDSLLYEQWATTRDLSWMRLMKRRRCVTVVRSKLRRMKARMWEGSSVMGVDKRIV